MKNVIHTLTSIYPIVMPLNEIPMAGTKGFKAQVYGLSTICRASNSSCSIVFLSGYSLYSTTMITMVVIMAERTRAMIPCLTPI